MRIKYEGPWPRRELWGRVFEQGETLEITGDDAEAFMEKALRLDGFVKPRGRPKKVTDDGEDEPERD